MKNSVQSIIISVLGNFLKQSGILVSISFLLQYRRKNYASAVFTNWLSHQAWENVLRAILLCLHICDVCYVAFQSRIRGIKFSSQALA